jgi:hypothetical protein
MQLSQVHVSKQELQDAKLVEVEAGELADGAVRLAIESFSVTANNVTYAVVGDNFGYWNFFPPRTNEVGKGIVPMWGHARVIESRHDEIVVGERVYGYLPMATHLDIWPGKVGAASFIDTAAHRQPMSPVYNQYTRLAADPEHDETREDERMIYGPLFKTGFMIDYFMRSKDWFGAEEVVLTSASSKTAMGLASVAKENSRKIKRIGLTSEGNADFVEETGLYDRVYTYAEIGNLSIRDCVSVDFAGNAEVLTKLHKHFSDTLKYSCLVGATHIEARSSFHEDADLPGPKPEMFFAPDHFVAFFKEHGPEKGGAMIAEKWHAFLNAVEGTVEIERREGLEAARATFVAMVGGEVDPSKGVVILP